MLDWRLKAFRHWITLAGEEPTWANIKHPPIDFQDIIYYSAPKQKIEWLPSGVARQKPGLPHEARRGFQ